MTQVLVLGATGRAGSAVLAHLTGRADTIAALRTPADLTRLPEPVRTGRTALIDLHHRILDATPAPENTLIVTIGGAGALHLPEGMRFWQHPAFPTRTLPRGRAHAHLRDHLETGQAGSRWAYLIPPPAFDPDGPATGRYQTWKPGEDETAFTRSAISYDDYALAVADASVNGWTGTHLTAAPASGDGSSWAGS